MLTARLGLSAETADVKVAVLERLDELIKFFQTTPLVQDPEARETLIDELKGERATWQTQPINDLMQ